MLSNSPKTINNDTATSVELIEEYRRQSALASSADRADIDLMDFLDQILLDQILLDTEQTPD
jgi:hypothetical protein